MSESLYKTSDYSVKNESLRSLTSVTEPGVVSEKNNSGLSHSFNNVQLKTENNTGLPDNIKSGIENLSGYSMDDVKVHYNSSKPTQLQAHAYTQGTDIHVASGQEKHLAHEAWHVVQQKQGRVQPTTQLQGVNVNDNTGLEKEADVMGEKALQMKQAFSSAGNSLFTGKRLNLIQAKKPTLSERADDIIKTGKRKIGSNIGELRPYLGEHENDLYFIYGLISGFTLNGIVSNLKTINSKDIGKKNKILQNDIAHEVQKVISISGSYTSYLGSDISQFQEGRIAELQGLAGELTTCARLIQSGKKVDSLGKVYQVENSSQEVDVTVEHNGKKVFIEVAASVSKLRGKISGGAQMEGYKNLVNHTDNAVFAYTSPDLKMSNISHELIDKLKNAGAWLMIGSEFFTPEELVVEENATSTSHGKPKKKKNKGGGKAAGRLANRLKGLEGRQAASVKDWE